MRFFIKINMGNDSMDSSEDIALALKKVANRLETGLYDTHPDDEYEVTITDTNGNSVGKWGFKRS